MKLVDKKGNKVGVVHYDDGRDIKVGDIIKTDKIYRVAHRVWEASIGEITAVIVEEITKIEELWTNRK